VDFKMSTEIFHSERITKEVVCQAVRMMEQRETIDMPRLSPLFCVDGTVYFVDTD
jgi:hypothetical protein